ncbi:hypothetical protein IVB18_22380 [Bradyrhizobium sp. 186]|uniref:hypothetical protein n=1 Tax=Bradyrhizobium sp. 186 TaxID=2782654 RepID=UPI0020016F00|nr:hypothetical protein [Bradyrhizobium sp. 186]UPK39728.1 hypothetical protein IVB18_22380 [Bradyrhizobium sp. 186]
MGNRTAKFISTLFASIIAGAPLAAVSQNAPSTSSTANAAAADCLASPKSTAPQGQHWHYRLDRSTKRQCWYLRAEDGKATTQSAQAATDTPAPDSAAPPQHPVQDARAEYLTPQSFAAPRMPNAPAQGAAIAPAAPQSPGANDSNAQQPALDARWPDASATVASPAPQSVTPPATAAAQPSAKPAKPAAPVALAAADASADRPTGSLQMLLLVIGGALALAGLLASLIYRFAGARVRVQAGDRRVNWDDWEPQDQHGSRAPWLNATPRTQQPRPVDFDAAPPQAATPVAIADKIDMVVAHKPAAAERDEAKIESFDGEFEVEASAPQLAANDTHDEEPADHVENSHDEDAVDIDVITTMLERLAKEGPRLTRPAISRADSAVHVRSLQDRPGVRA